MLKESFSYIGRAPWLMLFPGAALCVFSVLFNRVGDALSDWLDPRYTGGEFQ
jgi:ABC-type dipeptide/oligopeptide/nickel transport system permease subunit